MCSFIFHIAGEPLVQLYFCFGKKKRKMKNEKKYEQRLRYFNKLNSYPQVLPPIDRHLEIMQREILLCAPTKAKQKIFIHLLRFPNHW
jgi:hypothetical protein